jgi:lysozyme
MAENDTSGQGLDFDHPGPVENAVLGITTRNEGFRKKTYHVKGQTQRLIGFGHAVSGKHGGQPMTFREAAGQVGKDLAKAWKQVLGYINSAEDLAKHCRAALADLAMNIGANKLKGSKLINDINKGDMDAAQQDFHDYTHAKVHGKKVVLQGLVKRRDADANLFAGQIPEAGPMTLAEAEKSESKQRHTHGNHHAPFADRHVGHRANHSAMKTSHDERHGPGHYRYSHYHRHLSDRARGHHYQPT